MNPQNTIFEKRSFTLSELWLLCILIPVFFLVKNYWMPPFYILLYVLNENKSDRFLLILAYEKNFIIPEISRESVEWNFSDIVSIKKRKGGLTLTTINFQKIRISSRGILADSWKSVIHLFE